MRHICPVCGFVNLEEPAYDEFNDPSFEICPCCRFQFGDDDDVETHEGVFLKRQETHIRYRTKWIENGAEIFHPECYPQEFQSGGKVTKEHLIKQLKNINESV